MSLPSSLAGQKNQSYGNQTENVWDQEGCLMPWAAQTLGVSSPDRTAREEGMSFNEPTGDNNESSSGPAGFCCRFTLDHTGVTEHGFFLATKRNDENTVIISLHAEYDEPTKTLGVSCKPWFGVDPNKTTNMWDKHENRVIAIAAFETAFEALRSNESLYIRLSQRVAENIRLGTMRGLLQFSNTMMGEKALGAEPLSRIPLTSEGRPCWLSIQGRNKDHIPEGGCGPFPLESIVDPALLLTLLC